MTSHPQCRSVHCFLFPFAGLQEDAGAPGVCERVGGDAALHVHAAAEPEVEQSEQPGRRAAHPAAQGRAVRPRRRRRVHPGRGTAPAARADFDKLLHVFAVLWSPCPRSKGLKRSKQHSMMLSFSDFVPFSLFSGVGVKAHLRFLKMWDPLWVGIL